MLTRSMTLQDICLIAIIRDILLYLYNKTIPQKHIDFLFRAYPDELMSKYQDFKKSMNEDGMLFFMNCNIKKLTVPCALQSERVIEKLKMIGSGITSLNLSSSWDSKINEDELNSVVCSMPHLVHLNLSNTTSSDDTLAYILKFCGELSSLNVNSCYKITNRGMLNLSCGNLLLKNLKVRGTQVDYSGILTILDRIPSIEFVDFGKLAAFLYKFGNKMYNLTELDYFSYVPSDQHIDSQILQAWAEKCPKLEKLHFNDPVTQDVLNICAKFENLKELKITMFHRYEIEMLDVLTPVLPISQNIKTLILSCVSISLVTLLEYFRNLENLYLNDVSFTEFQKEDIKVSKTNLHTLILKSIDMEGTTWESVIMLIALSGKVSKLYLNNINRLPPEIVDVILGSMKNLYFVNLKFTHADINDINKFLKTASISNLVVDKYISANESFGKGTSCTLSWRNMYDTDVNYDNQISTTYEEGSHFF